MAKRKRLTPAQPDYLSADAPRAPESKGLSQAPIGVVPRSSVAAPPIAQVAGDAATVAALSEMTQMIAQARASGRMLLALSLDDVMPDYLVRDRLHLDGDDLDSLEQSLRARGQQTAIEVVDRGADSVPRYGLLSGWRRMAALRRIAQDDPARATVLAVVRQPDTAADAYIAMVEENEIRAGLSYYERARIVAKAVEQGVYPDVRAALHGLFGNVSRSKRSKIKSFLSIVEHLDPVLRFPASIPERLGLDMVKALGAPDTAARITTALACADVETAEEELACLAEVLRCETPAEGSREPQSDLSDAADPRTPERDTRDRTEGAARPETPATVPKRGTVTLSRSDDTITLKGSGVDDRLLQQIDLFLKQRGFELS